MTLDIKNISSSYSYDIMPSKWTYLKMTKNEKEFLKNTWKQVFSKVVEMLLSNKTMIYENNVVSIEKLFRSSPASTYFHGVEEGGLYTHCLNLFISAMDSCIINDIAVQWTQLAVIAICHDFCKIGLYHKNKYFDKNIAISDKNKPYVYDKQEHWRHASLSIERAESWGITLDTLERVCIKLHMSGWHQEEDMKLTLEEKAWLFDESLKHIQLLQLINLADAKN